MTTPCTRSKLNTAIPLIALMAATLNTGFAQEKSLLSLGYATTPLLQAVRGSRVAMDARALLKTRKEGQRLAKASFQNVEALVADLSEVELTPDDVELVDALQDAGIPVVLENATAPKMSQLFGIGIPASLVVVEHDPQSRRSRMTLADRLAMEAPPGYEVEPDPLQNFGNRIAFVQDLVKNRPFTRGAQAQASLGNCTLTNSNGVQLLPPEACRETEVTPQPTYFCPGMMVITGNTIGAEYTCRHGRALVDPRWEFGIYAVKTISEGIRKYAIVRAGGGWSLTSNSGDAPNTLSTKDRKFPFFSQYLITMKPSTGNGPGLPAGWFLDKAAPANANSSSQVSTTTGWTISAGASGGYQGGSSGGPGASLSLSVSYSSTQTSTTLLTDWATQSNLGNPNSWVMYYMASTQGCEGVKSVVWTQFLADRMRHRCSGRSEIGQPPLWSTAGNIYNGPLAETVWSGKTNSPFLVNLEVKARVNDVSINPALMWYGHNSNLWQQDDNRNFFMSVLIDPNRVRNN